MSATSIERWLYRVSMRLRSLFLGNTLDRELDEELQYHIEHLVETNRARGLSPDDARRAALLAVGGIEQRKESAATPAAFAWSRTCSWISATRFARSADRLPSPRPPS